MRVTAHETIKPYVSAMGNYDSKSTAESNFATDPEAAYIVLKKMNVSVTIVTWESAVFVRERVS